MPLNDNGNIDKNEALRQLNSEIGRFIEAATVPAKKPVFGEGPLSPALMLIGEAPGAQEEAQGHPFVGKAGGYLDEMLEATGFARSDIYITNAVKFRPTRESAAGRVINRAPTVAEINAQRPYLLREIDIVAPRIIATLGNSPLRALCVKPVRIGDVNGRILRTDKGAVVWPMYHPASLIYNPALRAVFQRDLSGLAALLRETGSN